MKNTLTLIGAIVVGIGVIAGAAIVVKKYVDKQAEKKRAEEDALFDCDGTCCDLGFDDEDEINWADIPTEDDEDILSEGIGELNDLDADKE